MSGAPHRAAHPFTMLMIWIVAVTGWLLAAIAWLSARASARRVTELTDQYWALKFEHSELKARLDGLDPSVPPREPAAPPAAGAFVPLSQVKR